MAAPYARQGAIATRALLNNSRAMGEAISSAVAVVNLERSRKGAMAAAANVRLRKLRRVQG
jgi:hypothetical protein